MALDRKQLVKPEKKLRKLLKNFPTQPTPDEVHDLRTNTRKVEALVKALQLDSRRNEQKLLTALTPVRRKAGNVRDMDVLTGFASTLHAGYEQDCRVALLEYLGNKRYRQAKKLARRVQSDRQKISRYLKKSAAHLDKMFAGPPQQSVDGQAATDAAAISLRLGAELGDPPRLNAGNLHEYRKKVKELRYILRFAQNGNSELVATLGEVKNAIGEWHDWLELQGMAEKALDHGSRCGLMHEIRAIGQDKFQHALSLTNRMRAQYTGMRSNRKSRPGSSTRLSRPVITAAAKLAA